MEPRREKAVLALVIASSAAVAVAAGLALRRPVIEEWLLWQLDSEDEAERHVALEELGRMRSVRAIPTLVAMLRREAKALSRSNDAHGVLVKIGAPAVPALVGAFRDPDPSVGFAAAAVLGEIGPAALPRLFRALEQRDETVRVFGKIALTRMDALGAPSVRMLRHADRFVRAAAAHVLASGGADAEFAIPALSSALEDEQAVVRAAAVEALGEIGPRQTRVAASLIRRRGDESAIVRAAVAEALGGVPKDVALAALTELLRDGDRLVRRTAAEALGRMRDASLEEIEPALTKALLDEEDEVRQAARRALEERRPSGRG